MGRGAKAVESQFLAGGAKPVVELVVLIPDQFLVEEPDPVEDFAPVSLR